MSLRKRILISVVLLIVCYFLYTRPEQVQRGSQSYDVEARIDADSNRSITILRSTEAFEIPAWYFEINQNGQRVVQTCFIHGCCIGQGNPKFRLVTTKDQSVVGLVSQQLQEELLVAYDFNSVRPWETPGDELSCERASKRTPAARDKLQADNPQLNLKLP